MEIDFFFHSDAYAVPANFLEIDVVNPMTTITAAKKRYTDYEVRMRVSNLSYFLSILNEGVSSEARGTSCYNRTLSLIVPELREKFIISLTLTSSGRTQSDNRLRLISVFYRRDSSMASVIVVSNVKHERHDRIIIELCLVVNPDIRQ